MTAMDETPTFLQREAALAALYPDEPRGLDTVVINFGPDPRIVEAEGKLRALERARRAAMLADFDRAHPITDGDRIRMSKAEAKRARRRDRHTR